MLNNFTYIRRELLESAVLDIYGDQLADQLNKRVRTCKVRYLEIWSPLISALMDAGGEEGKFGLGAVKSALPGQSRTASEGSMRPSRRSSSKGLCLSTRVPCHQISFLINLYRYQRKSNSFFNVNILFGMV
jgi:hypothetical protein